jgi:hypothetical protein
VSTAAAIVVATVALACPLHMLWRARQGRRECCAPARHDAAAALRARQHALADHIPSLRPEVRHEIAPERH